MRYFISTGEPSGDLHAGNLFRDLQSLDPGATADGFGGDRMKAAGVDLVYPLADKPIMGFKAAIASVPFMLGLLKKAKALFAAKRPDAVVCIDNPGFNWHVAAAAKQMGIPTVYYIPPQIWSWGSWRVARVRRDFDQVLCSLPFEEAWYQRLNVPQAKYVGHPFFDEIERRPLDARFIEEQYARPERKIVALLPGSRGQEVKWNFRKMLKAARHIHGGEPRTRFLVAGFKEMHRPMMEAELANLPAAAGLPLEIHFGRTPEIMHLADAAVSVSGSVSLELLHHGTPSVVMYSFGPFAHHV
ncbi:MAG: lipid-A-disaccharide synthase, partial [Planctomycetia bacterium]